MTTQVSVFPFRIREGCSPECAATEYARAMREDREMDGEPVHTVTVDPQAKGPCVLISTCDRCGYARHTYPRTYFADAGMTQFKSHVLPRIVAVA